MIKVLLKTSVYYTIGGLEDLILLGGGLAFANHEHHKHQRQRAESQQIQDLTYQQQTIQQRQQYTRDMNGSPNPNYQNLGQYQPPPYQQQWPAQNQQPMYQQQYAPPYQGQYTQPPQWQQQQQWAPPPQQQQPQQQWTAPPGPPPQQQQGQTYSNNAQAYEGQQSGTTSKPTNN